MEKWGHFLIMSAYNFNLIFSVINYNVQTDLVLTKPEDESYLERFDGYSSGCHVYF